MSVGTTNPDIRHIQIAGDSRFEMAEGRQMTIENTVSNDFYQRSSLVLTCSIAAYPV